ncbi:protein disulfide isomerase, putative [Trypanosoma brucei gambiense DAL972]|uniref:protein disulfide-isomerase n=1 Tax=Trypanosoma brucei gambiense (strain MHOM/CI/86/DAL972) TaxID=679716 RepID=C9ZS16_TRYB9|nr:protein disulfide isomerase, putative [Trypanosoma brucei gambiense DAL972]CBH12152.1 protein disulfide isomerase, putative [Trypanosoma brucei gambiense DAL972]|eukprot:XP_011774435.1 protein disulfide isomerase, putative [Trypanosoma brucei gambiense DAL972]
MTPFSCRKTSLLKAICIFAYFASAAHANEPDAALEGVADLTSSNFDSSVGKDVAALVEFYAPWCGHCKNLVPEFAKLGRAAAGAKDKVLIAKVDATAQKDLATRFEVNGYPTILFFPAGSQKPEKYSEGREAKAFVSYLNNQIKGLNLFLPREHKYVMALDQSNFDKVALDEGKDAFVLFYAPWCGHCKRLHPSFESLAKVYQNEKDLIIANVDADDKSNSEVTKRYKVEGYPTLVFFPKGNKGNPVNYEEGRTLDDMIKFVNERTGKKRTSSGDFDKTVGVDETVTNLMKEMAQSSKNKEERERLLAQIQQAVSPKALGEGAMHYIRIATNVLENGHEYISKEHERVGRLLKGSLTGAKRDSLTIRFNILSAIKGE